MFPVLQIGPFAVQAPGLFLLIGAWLGISLSERQAFRFNLLPNEIFNLIFISLVGGIIGARLGYALRLPAVFLSQPLSLIALNPTTLDVQAGLLAGILILLVQRQRKKLPLWHTLDALTPSLSIMMVAIALSHIASGDAFGVETDVPWGIPLWGAVRHPTQFYELLLALIIGLALYPGFPFVQRIWRYADHPGALFLFFLAFSATARIFVEAYRADSVFLVGDIRTAQVGGLILLGVSLWLLRNRLKLPNSQAGE